MTKLEQLKQNFKSVSRNIHIYPNDKSLTEIYNKFIYNDNIKISLYRIVEHDEEVYILESRNFKDYREMVFFINTNTKNNTIYIYNFYKYNNDIVLIYRIIQHSAIDKLKQNFTVSSLVYFEGETLNEICKEIFHINMNVTVINNKQDTETLTFENVGEMIAKIRNMAKKDTIFIYSFHVQYGRLYLIYRKETNYVKDTLDYDNLKVRQYREQYLKECNNRKKPTVNICQYKKNKKEVVINTGKIDGKLDNLEYINSFLDDKILIELQKTKGSFYIKRDNNLLIDKVKTKLCNKLFENGKSNLVIKEVNVDYKIERDEFNVEKIIEHEIDLDSFYKIISIGNDTFKNDKCYKGFDIKYICNELKKDIKIKEISLNEDYILYDKWIIRNLKMINQQSNIIKYLDKNHDEITQDALLLPKYLFNKQQSTKTNNKQNK